jgi:hypothetical protein
MSAHETATAVPLAPVLQVITMVCTGSQITHRLPRCMVGHTLVPLKRF